MRSKTPVNPLFDENSNEEKLGLKSIHIDDSFLNKDISLHTINRDEENK